MTAAKRRARWPEAPAPTPVGLQLVASAEPGVVLSSLATQCVPELCDDCTIDIVDGVHARYRVEYPPREEGTRHDRATPEPSTQGLARLSERAALTPDRVLRVPFSHPSSDTGPDAGASESPRVEEFTGEATFVWHLRAPTLADRTVLTVLVTQAVQTVLWQRSEHRARAAVANAEHLRAALRTSRSIGTAIGIIMGLEKITQDQAFELLSLASQRTDRKLRELALEVIDTGWIDPALTADPARGNRRAP